MFCREVGTTSIRGISDKNKAEIPSKKTFFLGRGGYRCNRQGPGRRGCERPLGRVWRPAEGGCREYGAETTQAGGGTAQAGNRFFATLRMTGRGGREACGGNKKSSLDVVTQEGEKMVARGERARSQVRIWRKSAERGEITQNGCGTRETTTKQRKAARGAEKGKKSHGGVGAYSDCHGLDALAMTGGAGGQGTGRRRERREGEKQILRYAQNDRKGQAAGNGAAARNDARGRCDGAKTNKNGPGRPGREKRGTDY